MEKETTAVNWLIEVLPPESVFGNDQLISFWSMAKKFEMDSIKRAYLDGYNNAKFNDEYIGSQYYYNQKFGGDHETK